MEISALQNRCRCARGLRAGELRKRGRSQFLKTKGESIPPGKLTPTPFSPFFSGGGERVALYRALEALQLQRLARLELVLLRLLAQELDGAAVDEDLAVRGLRAQAR